LLLKDIKAMDNTIQQSYQGFDENSARYSQAADMLRLSGVAPDLNAAATNHGRIGAIPAPHS